MCVCVLVFLVRVFIVCARGGTCVCVCGKVGLLFVVCTCVAVVSLLRDFFWQPPFCCVIKTLRSMRWVGGGRPMILVLLMGALLSCARPAAAWNATGEQTDNG